MHLKTADFSLGRNSSRFLRFHSFLLISIFVHLFIFGTPRFYLIFSAHKPTSERIQKRANLAFLVKKWISFHVNFYQENRTAELLARAYIFYVEHKCCEIFFTPRKVENKLILRSRLSHRHMVATEWPEAGEKRAPLGWVINAPNAELDVIAPVSCQTLRYFTWYARETGKVLESA